MSPIGALDVVAVGGFLTAAVLALKVRTDRPLGGAPKWLLVATMGLFAVTSASNVAEWAFGVKAFDVYEDFLEVLFTPLFLYYVYLVYLRYQMERHDSAERILRQEHELLMNVVDTTPAGILLLDSSGGITFANEGAKRILELAEDAGTGSFRPGAWTMRYPADALRLRDGQSAFGKIVAEGPHHLALVEVHWEDKHVTTLSLSSTPMQDRTGRVGGAVVAFEDVTGQLEAPAEGA